MVTIALFYKVLPDTKVAWRDVWLGAIIASLLIEVAVTLAGWFFQNSSLSSALQVAGGFTLLLLGFYYMCPDFSAGGCVLPALC